MICKVRETINGWRNSRYNEIQVMARGMIAKFDKYWSDIPGVMAVAVVLDPSQAVSNINKSELERYLEEQVENNSHDFDILSWWKESAFSAGGRFLSPHCIRLHTDTLEALMCTQNWIWAPIRGYDPYAYEAAHDPSLYAYGAYAGCPPYPQQCFWAVLLVQFGILDGNTKRYGAVFVLHHCGNSISLLLADERDEISKADSNKFDIIINQLDSLYILATFR
ncbi:hypothetical protein Ddye_027201 [Dipteronia dyeriana]|uniref:Uncharacterized protein n=1 Tax=Dipteronia dyeriana TaxID=168575 RepID=A0AAD9WQ88_9ROSI|nr:hypothetical protein Ddye_027201 [Dipteronia dyeriana]